MVLRRARKEEEKMEDAIMHLPFFKLNYLNP